MSLSAHCVGSLTNASSTSAHPSPSVSGQAILPFSEEFPYTFGQSSDESAQSSPSVSRHPTSPSVEVPGTLEQSSLPSLKPSPSSSLSSSTSLHPSPSMSVVESEIHVGRGGLYDVRGHASTSSLTPSLSISLSSILSRHPSRSQSVELAGSLKSCVDVQLY